MKNDEKILNITEFQTAFYGFIVSNCICSVECASHVFYVSYATEL